MANRSSFDDRDPEYSDTVTTGLIDLTDDCLFRPLADSSAWSLLSGARIQWIGPDCQRKVLYHDTHAENQVSVVVDICSGAERVYPHSITPTTRDGRRGFSVDYRRVKRGQPAYGYPSGNIDPIAKEPDIDGIRLVDLTRGTCRLIVSMAELAQWNRHPSMESALHWIAPIHLSRGDSRIAFLHRRRKTATKRWIKRIFDRFFSPFIPRPVRRWVKEYFSGWNTRLSQSITMGPGCEA